MKTGVVVGFPQASFIERMLSRWFPVDAGRVRKHGRVIAMHEWREQRKGYQTQ